MGGRLSPRMEILATPTLDTAEVRCTGGRGTQTVIVERRGLAAVAIQLVRGREQIERARSEEAEPDSVHTMGFRGSTLSFGIGHFEVRAYGPNADSDVWIDGERIGAVRGQLVVWFWAKRRGYPAIARVLSEQEEAELIDVLRRAAEPPERGSYTWEA